MGLIVPAFGVAQTLPCGPTVASGQVTTSKAANTLSINQSSENAIVNWQSFSIGSGGTVIIHQPNSEAALLDRVTGRTPSVLAGHLDANGQVYLINPNGIAITTSGIVDVEGGFVASTLDLSDDDFKTGKLTFNGAGTAAGVSNQGSITVGRGGYAALLGGKVNNSGLISVPLGKIGLGSGEAATLDVSGDGFLQVAVPMSAGGNAALIQSSGTLSARGGTVILSAATARAAARNAIDLSGIAQATSISGHLGEITLSGGAGGTVDVTGDIDVSGRSAAATTGGGIAITGESIALNGATLDASGAAGGGTIRIGGDEHGAGTLPTAETLSVDAASLIEANAAARGNGGSIVLWSDERTDFSGKITATGAAAGGAGGNAEVSSKNLLNYQGIANLSAPHGAFGDLVLDPYDITISGAGTSNGTLSVGTFTPNGSNSVLNAGALDTQLGVSNVTVSTGGSSPGSDTGNITVATGLNWSTGSTLTLEAYHSIAINAPITIAGAGGLSLTTNYSGGSGGTLSFAQGAEVNYGAINNGGSLSINGQSYTLLYKLTDSTTAIGNGPYPGGDAIAGIDYNVAAGRDNGYYALATNVSGTGSAAAPQFAHQLVGPYYSPFNGTFEGLGNTITNLTVSDSADTYVGLFGYVGGTVRDLGLVGGFVSGAAGGDVGGLAGATTSGASISGVWTTAAVSAASQSVAGGLVGYGTGTSISDSYATGAVTAGSLSQIGGLMGSNNNGSINNSYATGAVSAGSGSVAGGLVAFNASNNANATITNSYATGAVSAGASGVVGGLAGYNVNYTGTGTATIANSYATGAVSAGSGASVGGLVGYNQYGTVNASYWDTTTSGTLNSGGGGGAGTGLTTDALQSTSTTGVTLGNAFAGGAAGTAHGGTNGEYPYLVSFFPNGVQAIAGIAYQDAGLTPLVSGTAGAASVSTTVNGVLAGTATTGANGYYYLVLQPGTISSSGATLLAYSSAPSAAQQGAVLTTANGSLRGLDVYGGYLQYSTAATTYSTAIGGFTYAQTALASYSTTPSFIGGLGPYFVASGSSFTLDQALTLNSNLGVETTASNAPITVAAPLILTGSNALALNASGALAIDAQINVSAAGSVALAYNTSTPTNLTFAEGDSIDYGPIRNGGSLSINGQPYTLLYKLTDSTAATGNGTDSGTDDIAGIDNNSAAGGDVGNYALASNVSGTGSAAAPQFAHPLFGSGTTVFRGSFEGLGNTITNLTINDGTAEPVGLIGMLGNTMTTGGTVRDVGLVGGSITSGYQYGTVGSLVGVMQAGNAVVANSYSTAAVSTVGYDAGGLVGAVDTIPFNQDTIINSYATGAVSVGSSPFSSYSSAGGLVGFDGEAIISDTYATGAVTGGFSAHVGGLVGSASIIPPSNSYATGAVSGGAGSSIGGLVGYGPGPVSNNYWDTTTSGITTDGGPGSPAATGLSTAALQSTATGSVSLGAAFAGGAAGTAHGGTNGEYPFLVSFFPNGVQAISGIAYQDAGTTPLASGTSGAGVVGVSSGGVLQGTSSTGVNGYYYVVVPAGTLAANQGVAAFIQANGATGAQNAVTFAQSSGGATLANLDVDGGWERDQPGASLTSLTGLNAALGTAEGATAPAAFTLANREIDAPGAFTLDQPVSESGALALSSPGLISESGSATITAAGLLVSGAGGSYALGNANQIGSLAASSGSLSLNDAASLTTGSIGGATGTSIAGVTTTGAVTLISTGSITLASGAGVSGQSPVLAASGAFVNDAGANAVTASTGRWLIYTNAPGTDTFGGLNSANTAIFGVTQSSLPAGSVTQNGNRYLFANEPVLTVASTNDSKTYGVDDTASILGDYSITGFPVASGAFATDTVSRAVSGTPNVTSAGSSAYAAVGSSPYTMTVSAGSLSSSAGYTFNYVSSGELTVNPATITVAGATGINKTYDATTTLPNGAVSFTASGIYGTDASHVTVSAGSAAYASPNAGPENVNVSGLTLSGSAAGNYALASTSVTGGGTISPALVTLGGTRIYDGATDANGAVFSPAGTVAGVAGQTLTLTGAGTLAGKNAGNEALVSLGTLSLGNGTGLADNYTLTGGTDTVTVTPATITVTGATGVDKTYNGTTALPTGATGFTTSGLYASDASDVTVTAAHAAYASPAVGSEPVRVTGLTLTGPDADDYVLSATMVNGSGRITQAPEQGPALPPAGVPGTLSTQLENPSPDGFASTEFAAAFDELPTPRSLMPRVYARTDDLVRPWWIIDSLSSRGFDRPVPCIEDLCVCTEDP